MDNDKKISIGEYDYWTLRSSHEELAKESKNVRHLVMCAKERLRNVATGVICSADESRLAHNEQYEHVYEAMRLLNLARDIEKG